MPSNFRDKHGRDPFADEEGRNPYADDGREVAPAVANGQGKSPTAAPSPYQASDMAQYKHRPGDFETLLPHRGGLLLGVAVVGLVVGLTGIPVWLIWNMEVGVLALGASLPAFILAWQDLRAIQVQAMDPAGKRLTGWAAAVGLVGMAVASISVILLVVRVVGWIRPASA